MLATYFLLRSKSDKDALEKTWNDATRALRDYLGGKAEKEIKEGVADLLGVEKLAVFFLYHATERPDWINGIGGLLADSSLESGPGASYSAGLLVQYEGRIWLVAFGSFHFQAKKLPIYRRFGVVTTANAAEPEEIRSFMANVSGPMGKHRTEKRPRKGNFNQFDIPKFAKQLAKLGTKVTTRPVPVTMEGAIGCRYLWEDDPKKLQSILKELGIYWNDGAHKYLEIEAFDIVQEVDDPDLLERLDQILDDALMSEDESSFGLFTSEEAFYDSPELKIKGARRHKVDSRVAPEIISLLHIYRAFRTQGVRSSDIVVYYTNPENNHDKPILIKELLSYDYVDPITNSAYVWDDGSWKRITKDHYENAKKIVADRIERSEQVLRSNSHGLGRYNGGKEDDYLKTNTSLRIKHVHTKKLPIFDTNLEAADLFLDGNIFLAVKRKCDWQSVNLVCAQARSAAEFAATNPDDFNSWATSIFKRKVNVKRDDVFFGILLLVEGKKKDLDRLKFRAVDELSTFSGANVSVNFESIILIR